MNNHSRLVQLIYDGDVHNSTNAGKVDISAVFRYPLCLPWREYQTARAMLTMVKFSA
jgi:hypothetical protein